MSFAHQLAYWAGLTDGTKPPYLAWSGIFTNLAYLAVLSVLFRRVHCSVSTCRRPGLYQVAGTEYTVCRRHHPAKGISVTHQMIVDAYAAGQGRNG